MTEARGKAAAELSESFLSLFDSETLEQNHVLTEEKYDELLGKLSQPCESWEDENCADRRRYCLLYGNNFLAERSNGNLLLRRHQFFDTLLKSHVENEHGDVDCMWKDLKPQYSNISKQMIRKFIEICVSCKERSKILAPEKVTSAYIEVCDVYRQGRLNFCNALIYEDMKTRFVVVSQLSDVTFYEIVRSITQIFSFFGAACVVSARSSKHLALKDIQKLKTTFINTVINQSKGSRPEEVRTARRFLKENVHDAESSMHTYLFNAQMQTNTLFNSILGMTPFEARYGVAAVKGTINAGVDKEFLEKARNEDEFKQLLRDARARAISGNSQDAITNG